MEASRLFTADFQTFQCSLTVSASQKVTEGEVTHHPGNRLNGVLERILIRSSGRAVYTREDEDCQRDGRVANTPIGDRQRCTRH